jgi:hypothetical protein
VDLRRRPAQIGSEGIGQDALALLLGSVVGREVLDLGPTGDHDPDALA